VKVAARKAAEIDNKLASLDVEFEHWRRQASANGPLEKHHTQVDAVTRELAVPVARLRERVGGLQGSALLAAGTAIENEILDVHRIWDHFRSKLALRYVEHFAGYLLAADELAYRCYARAEVRGASREPALLYFGDERSPIMRPRGARLSPAAANGKADPVSEAVQRLPVPLIGIPWFQVAHLPDAPAIAHEVGHDVEVDLGLADEVERLVERRLLRAGVCDEHRTGWREWRAEIFADVFATLALGPAYTATMMDFLAIRPAAVAAQLQGAHMWSRHPPSTLRVLLSTATLASMRGMEDDGARLRDAWFEAYPVHAMECYTKEVPLVAAAILDGPYEALDGGHLTALIDFSGEPYERALLDAERIPRKGALTGADARELVAAARFAFDADPDGYRAAGVSERVLETIRKKQTVGTRAGSKTPVGADVRAARAEERGRWLADHLARAHAQDLG
jgi:hypothetical protein